MENPMSVLLIRWSRVRISPGPSIKSKTYRNSRAVQKMPAGILPESDPNKLTPD